jgi:hypothetical protein
MVVDPRAVDFAADFIRHFFNGFATFYLKFHVYLRDR